MAGVVLSAHPLPGLALVEQARHARQALANRNDMRPRAEDRGEYVLAKPEGAFGEGRGRRPGAARFGAVAPGGDAPV